MRKSKDILPYLFTKITAVFPGLFTYFSGFVYEKTAVFPGLFTKIRPLLTYSNRNITARRGALKAPPCLGILRGIVLPFLFCGASYLKRNRGRL